MLQKQKSKQNRKQVAFSAKGSVKHAETNPIIKSGAPIREVVSEKLINDQIDRKSIREIERMMKAKTSQTTSRDLLNPGMKALVYLKSSKNNESNEWADAIDQNADENIITCKRKSKGPDMKIGYKDIRIMRSGELTNELVRSDMNTDKKAIDDMQNDNTTTNEMNQTNTEIPNDSTLLNSENNTNTNLTVTAENSDLNIETLNIQNYLRAAIIGNLTKDIGDVQVGSDEVTGDIESDLQKDWKN